MDEQLLLMLREYLQNDIKTLWKDGESEAAFALVPSWLKVVELLGPAHLNDPKSMWVTVVMEEYYKRERENG